ncbi:hypothetical protein SDC9_167656 [bioreactor metagenome]|uniref:Uncharacterized protein n=1 Tax=bioreactor metagenome TaxID=1076179 RepID=A0A645G0C6_9ZZZZ
MDNSTQTNLSGGNILKKEHVVSHQPTWSKDFGCSKITGRGYLPMGVNKSFPAVFAIAVRVWNNAVIF